MLKPSQERWDKWKFSDCLIKGFGFFASFITLRTTTKKLEIIELRDNLERSAHRSQLSKFQVHSLKMNKMK